MRDSQGTLNKLVTDPSLYNQLADAAQKLNTVVGRLEKGQGTLGNMLNNEEAWKELTNSLHDLNLLLEDVRKNPHKYFKFSVF